MYSIVDRVVMKPGKGLSCMFLHSLLTMVSVGYLEGWPCTKPGKIQKVVVRAHTKF